ncbi:O-antigen ligase family protein [Nostoc sp. 'Lobaria pulmonaria (5183) cyanobiont']|uniref:O-antigen ligase family protein n=1 Tax=Nostoc sp. 'Lobaria pulmonaria (5183) cyanobiont' TaxID=1618022 RepID=UPI000CF309AD|nr:O-antigen ligase family protein [Nostoc sp. 'Lobaria pulmonaria (5183) cyanobiont']AVH73805.1 O-antigen ligase [Nostoc sp. 'Lobaria pulmonaria (5183) cyanobiont']
MINIFFLLILFSSLLGRIKFPGINIGIHYLLLPAFSLGIISLSLKSIPEVVKKHQIILISISLMYLWMWLSSLMSEFPNTAITYSLKYSTYYILFFAFLILTFKKIATPTLTFYYRCILYLLQIIAGLGFLEVFLPNNGIFKLLKFPSFYPEIGSIMQNPNQFGVIVAIGLCLSLILEKQNKISKIELNISELIFTISLALSASGNGWVIFIIGMFLLLIYKIISFRKMIYLTSLLFLCIVTVPVSTRRIGLADSKIFPLSNVFIENSNLLNPHGKKISTLVGTGFSRFEMWQAAINETIKRPLTGIGIGVFPDQIGVKVWGKKGYHAHNIFLNVSAEQGIPGLLLFTNFLAKIAFKVKYANPLITVPIIMFLASQIADVFTEDYTFTTIEFYFIAAAINSRKDVVDVVMQLKPEII